MNNSEIHHLLLEIASIRLRNMPGAYHRFQLELDRTIEGAIIKVGIKLAPAAAIALFNMGQRDALDKHLTSLIDEWAHRQPALSVQPLPARHAAIPTPPPQAAPASEPVTPADVPPEQTDDAGLTRREMQIRAIESAIKKLNLPAMSIPTGGKKKVETECKRASNLFGGGIDPFKEAWQEAVKQKRVRTVRHNEYARRD